jgi:hypothetical protein
MGSISPKKPASFLKPPLERRLSFFFSFENNYAERSEAILIFSRKFYQFLK